MATAANKTTPKYVASRLRYIQIGFLFASLSPISRNGRFVLPSGLECEVDELHLWQVLDIMHVRISCVGERFLPVAFS